MKKIEVLHVLPKDGDYVFEEITASQNGINKLLNKSSIFVEISHNFGFFMQQLNEGESLPTLNFYIAKDADIVDEVYGPVVFTRVNDKTVPIGLTDEEAEVIAQNLVEMSNRTRMLFLDVIGQHIEQVRV